MDKVWSWIAVELGKYAKWVAVIGVLVTVLLGLGITQLDFATGQDSYLNKSDQAYKDNLGYQETFGGSIMLTVVTMDEGHTVEELFDAPGRAQFEAFHTSLTDSGRFKGVVTPLIALEFTQNLVTSPDGNPANSVGAQALLRAAGLEAEGSPEQTARNTDIGRTLERLSVIPADQQTYDNPEWVKFLLYDNAGEIRRSLLTNFPDNRHAVFVTRLHGNLSIEDEGADARLVEDAGAALQLPNATSVTTGPPVFLRDLNDYLRGGMLTLGAIAVGIMVVILLLLFDVRWRLLPLGVILIGVIWAFGLAGYLGIPLTVVTIAGLPVMLGVGIDYAIQMHARVEEEVVVDRAAHPIQETSRNLGPALLVVTFDAIFAFAALRFAKVPMLRDFGLLLAVGIAVICLASIIIPLAVLGIREFKSPTKATKDFREGFLGRLTVKLGELPSKLAVPLIVASIAIFIGGILVEDKLTLQTDPVKWVNQDSQTIKDIRTVERETGSSNEMGVFVQSDDPFTDENAAFLHEFRRQTLAQHGDVLRNSASIEEVIGDAIFVEGATDLAPSGDDVRRTYEVAPPDVKALFVAADQRALSIIFPTRAGTTIEEWQPVVDDIRDDTAPPAGLSVRPAGLAVVGVGLLENLEANRVLLTYLAMLFVFLFLAVRLRSIVRSLLSLVPVAIAVGAASLISWAAGFELSPMTAVGGPLVIAACTEFTSLILLRFVEERGRGLDPKEAIDVTASRTGRAFIVSALTAIAGVAVLSFSSLPLLRDFGRIVAMNVAVALLSALVFLPPMLVWAEQRGWVTRGLLKKRPPPMIDTPDYQPAD